MAVMLGAGILPPVPPVGESPKDAPDPGLVDSLDDATRPNDSMSTPNPADLPRNDRWVLFPAAGPGRRWYLVAPVAVEEAKQIPDEAVDFAGGSIRRTKIILDGRVLGFVVRLDVLGTTSAHLSSAAGATIPGADVNALIRAARTGGLPVEPEPVAAPQIPTVTVTPPPQALRQVELEENLGRAAAALRVEVAATKAATTELIEARTRLGDSIRTARQFESGALVSFPTWEHVEDVASLAESAALAGAVDRIERHVADLRRQVRARQAAQETQSERWVCVPTFTENMITNGVQWLRESQVRRPRPAAPTETHPMTLAERMEFIERAELWRRRT